MAIFPRTAFFYKRFIDVQQKLQILCFLPKTAKSVLAATTFRGLP